jgi:hypothetical protein
LEFLFELGAASTCEQTVLKNLSSGLAKQGLFEQCVQQLFLFEESNCELQETARGASSQRHDTVLPWLRKI